MRSRSFANHARTRTDDRRRAARRLRPFLDHLEDRLVPSTVQYTLVNDWGSGFQGKVTIGNDQATDINGWTLEFDFPGQVTQVWDAVLVRQTGNHFILEDAGYDATIAVGKSVSFGFLASPGNSASPSNFLVNGVPPTGSGGGGGTTPTPTLAVADASVVEGNPAAQGAAGYLRTEGSQIVDAQGNAVKISGVNWFGFETRNYAPHGLWARGYREMMDQMRTLGFNTIRMPFSNALFDPGTTPNGIDFAKNPDLQGLSGPQIMDKIVDYAGQIGLRIFLDNHRSSAGDGTESELWYTSAYPESRWISDWTMLAQRYANNPAVIGGDLRNEVHGAASWGSGNLATDWRLAAQRAGNAILAVNPNWLVIVEGVEKGPSGNNWWGGNLSAAGAFPVQLNIPNRLVYSPHDYPESIYAQPWFSDPSYPNNLPAIWDKNWGYLARQGIAPVLLGEFGTKLQTTSDRQWLAMMTTYLGGDFDANGTNDLAPGHQGPSWTWWSWNPNSGDTGGILKDDWSGVQQEKVDALKPLQFAGLGGGGATTASLSFTVTLSAPSTRTVTVAYATANGTAAAGTDYVAASGTLTFAPGETRKTVSVSIIPDLAVENNETILLRLSSPTNATVPQPQAVGTILNDDTGPLPPPTPSLAIADASVIEGDSGTVNAIFTVKLSAASSSTVTVAYATQAGTATAGTDFTTASGTLTFAPGQTSKTITVAVKGDLLDETDETFQILLSNASGAAIADASATGTIRDNDPPTARPAIGFIVKDNWGTGFVADLIVRTTAITDWVLAFEAPFRITNIWNAKIVSRVGTRYTIRAMSYNGQIAAGGMATFGFQGAGAVGSGLTNVTLNGKPVAVG